MIEIPDRFPLPQDAFERQRSVLGTYVVGRQHPSPRRFRGIVAVAAVIVAGGLLVTPALGIGSRLLDLIQDGTTSRQTREPVWSRDGRKIVYVSRGDRNTWDLYVINVDGSGQRMLTSVSSASAAWSPDGRKIAFAGARRPGPSDRRLAGGLWVINADGSGKRKLAPKGEDPAWSPDGRTIAFAASPRLYVVNADGGGRRRLAGNTVAGSGKGGRMSSPAWSPDGRRILFSSNAGTSCDFCFHVYVVNADGSGERRLTSSATPGPPTPSTVPGHYAPAWSPDGRRIAFVRTTGIRRDLGDLWVMNADGRAQRKLTLGASGWPYAAVAWSPNGRKLAFTSNRDGNADVYTVDSDGSGLRRLTNKPEFDGDAVWSPDGRQLVFVSNRDGSNGVYIVNADGSGQRRLTAR
jgi:Tol biopolymer transport system component